VLGFPSLPLFSLSFFSVQLTTGVSLRPTGRTGSLKDNYRRRSLLVLGAKSSHRSTGLAPISPEAVIVRFLWSSSHSPFTRTSSDTSWQGRPCDLDSMHAFIRASFFSPPPSFLGASAYVGGVVSDTVIAHVHVLYNPIGCSDPCGTEYEYPNDSEKWQLVT
jgi:hypothetical protein